MSVQAEFDFEAAPKSEATASLIERIKKLLRLGADKRGNAHEAERAMQLAFELAEKYRVDLESLDLDEESARLVHDFIDVGGRFDRLRRGVFSILQTFFHVTACLSGARMMIIGRPTDVMIAHYIHDFLLRAGRSCLRAYEQEEKARRRRLTTAKRSGYIEGFIYGVCSKLNATSKTMALGDNHTAIVIAEKAAREAKLAELVPRRGTVKKLEGRKNRNALDAGFEDGRQTQIHQPLNAAPGAPLRLQ